MGVQRVEGGALLVRDRGSIGERRGIPAIRGWVSPWVRKHPAKRSERGRRGKEVIR